MAYVWQRWLADELRAAGLKVVEINGWQNRGRPASTGHFDPKGASTVHHTGATTSASNPAAGLSLLINGRSDLPGPLCQIATAYDGTVYVIAAGRANHAGRVGKPGQMGMPFGSDGNAQSIGNEVMTNGTQKMPEAQKEAIAIAHAVICLHWSRNEVWTHRHADISGTGKWDIGQWSTEYLRSRVGDAISDLSKPVPLERPKRVQKALAEIKTEIKRVKAARTVARNKGEKVAKYNEAIKALKQARRSLKKVPRR